MTYNKLSIGDKHRQGCTWDSFLQLWMLRENINRKIRDIRYSKPFSIINNHICFKRMNPLSHKVENSLSNHLDCRYRITIKES